MKENIYELKNQIGLAKFQLPKLFTFLQYYFGGLVYLSTGRNKRDILCQGQVIANIVQFQWKA
jgi:hypothetical protein